MAISISIITAVCNAAGTLEDCLASVRSQSHPSHHILINGCSTDGTEEIIERHRSGLALVISEPDRGFYDALNKGLSRAKGDVIGILNADDVYANDGVLAKVAGLFDNDKVDSCYGDLVYVDREDMSRMLRYWRSCSYQESLFYRGWMPPHPSFFVRRKIYEKYGGFNLQMGTAADYELMLRFLLKHKITTAYIPKILVRMRQGGQSNLSLKNRLQAHRMDRLAWKVNGLHPYPWTLLFKPLSKIGQYFLRPRLP